MKTNFTALDFVVLVAYLIGTTALGIWLGRNQKDAKDYFVAGHTIPWWAVLFSVVATETSALTFISIPGLAYTTQSRLSADRRRISLGRIVVAYTLLPRYYQGDLVTAYALLEKRFGVATRRFASIVFMVTRAFADSVRVFATAIPIALIIGRRCRSTTSCRSRCSSSARSLSSTRTTVECARSSGPTCFRPASTSSADFPRRT